MISASVCLVLDMLLPLSKLQNHTQFCADLGEQVSDVNSGAVTVILTSDLCPLKREQFKALVYSLPDCKDGG
jgi:hypothetical protein